MSDSEVQKELNPQQSREGIEEAPSLSHAKETLVTSERLQTELLIAIGNIKNHPQWQSKIVKGFWEKLDPSDRKLLYDKGKPGFRNAMENGSFVFGVLPSMKYKDNRLKFMGNKLSRWARPLVQLDLLPRPEGITSEDVKSDILNDKKSLKRMLKALRKIVILFAPEVAPEFAKAEAIIEKGMEIQYGTAEKLQENKAA